MASFAESAPRPVGMQPARVGVGVTPFMPIAPPSPASSCSLIRVAPGCCEPEQCERDLLSTSMSQRRLVPAAGMS